jgi:hypothetical protein
MLQKSWFSRLRITLAGDHILLSVTESCEISLQEMEVLLGPFDFRPN